jgi:hypothetical protein
MPLLPLVTGVRAVCDSSFPLGPLDLGRRRFIRAVDVGYFDSKLSSELSLDVNGRDVYRYVLTAACFRCGCEGEDVV